MRFGLSAKSTLYKPEAWLKNPRSFLLWNISNTVDVGCIDPADQHTHTHRLRDLGWEHRRIRWWTLGICSLEETSNPALDPFRQHGVSSIIQCLIWDLIPAASITFSPWCRSKPIGQNRHTFTDFIYSFFKVTEQKPTDKTHAVNKH